MSQICTERLELVGKRRSTFGDQTIDFCPCGHRILLGTLAVWSFWFGGKVKPAVRPPPQIPAYHS